MMRLMRGAIIVTLSIIALAGCATPDPTPGPYHRWFNPDGVEVSAQPPDICAPDEVAGPPAVLPPLSAPGGVAAGYDFATVELRVEALVVHVGADPVDNLCIPVAVHAYVNVNGSAAPITVHDEGGVRIESTPWDALRNTPYGATGLIVWKGGAPVVSIDWSARYEREVDRAIRPDDQIIGLACSVFVNGTPYARTISLDVEGPAGTIGGAQGAVTGPFVRCNPDTFTPRAALS